MQNQPVVSIVPIGLGHDFFEPAFDLIRRLANRQRYPVGDAENMRIDGDCWRAERDIHDHIGCLAANARQGHDGSR